MHLMIRKWGITPKIERKVHANWDNRDRKSGFPGKWRTIFLLNFANFVSPQGFESGIQQTRL